MKKPQNMPKILDMTALVVVGINVPFAIYGYLLFGENTQGMYGHSIFVLFATKYDQNLCKKKHS